MTANAIRVQLPGGQIYAPALLEAAAKTGARSGLPTKTAKALCELVNLSIAMLNSGRASMITLQMQVHDASISATITGKACTDPSKTSTNKLSSAAAKKARSFETKSTASALTICFEV